MPMTIYRAHFRDRSFALDQEGKTALSCRDGVLEYLGAELGLEPANRVFTVYRSPATIANAAMQMAGIPVTNEHVEVGPPVPDALKISAVVTSTMVDRCHEKDASSVAVQNTVDATPELLQLLDNGKRELSLGYDAGLREHHTFDFEQVDIVPHHLAVVEFGRCGPECSFIDNRPEGLNMKKGKKLLAAFCDQEGALSIEQLAEIVNGLPDAIKSLPLDRLQEFAPVLQQIVAAAKEAGVEVAPVETPAAEVPAGEDPAAMEDEDPTPPGDQPKPSEEKQPVMDAAKIRQITDAATKEHARVIMKARDFLDKNYDFAGKTTAQIMRDAIASETSEQFADNELALAFKMLKRSPGVDYSQFGDAKTTPGSLETLKNKEL